MTSACDVTQGVVVSDDDLMRTFLELEREEEEPEQQGEEPVDGKTSRRTHTFTWPLLY